VPSPFSCDRKGTNFLCFPWGYYIIKLYCIEEAG
jgi:hypothetical protein